MALSLKMVAARLRKRLNRVANDQAAVLAEVVEDVQARGLLGGHLKLQVRRPTSRRAGGLEVRIALQRGGRGRRKFSFAQVLRIGLLKVRSRKTLATIMQAAPSTISLMQSSLARAYLSAESLWLSWLAKYIDEHPPDFAMSSQLWDETGERLALGLLKKNQATLPQQSSVWHVLVCRFRFMMVWVADDGAQHRSLVFDPAIPPMPVLSVATRHLYSALEKHPSLAEAVNFRKRLFEKSRVAFECHEEDGATANDKYHAWKAQNPVAAHASCSLLKCGNHGNQLIEGHMVAMGGKAPRADEANFDLLSDLYAATLFLRMGGHFVRLLSSSGVFARRLRVVRSSPPAGVSAFAAEMTDWLVLAHQNSDAVSSVNANSRYRMLVDDYFSVFNGDPSLTGLTHLSEEPVHLPSLQKKAAVVINNLVLRGVPSVPAQNKWTRFAPCLNFFVLGSLFGLLPSMVKNSSDVLANQPDLLVDSAGADDQDQKSPTFDWHRVAGARLRRFLRVMQSKEERFVFLVVSASLEPLRYLTKFFMSASNRPRLYDRPPPLLELLLPEASPLIWVTQYYSELLAGECGKGRNSGRLILIWAMAGHASMLEWMQERPGRVLLVRRLSPHVVGRQVWDCAQASGPLRRGRG